MEVRSIGVLGRWIDCNTSLLRYSCIKLDRAFKCKLSWASERNIAKLLVDPVEPNAEFVPPTCNHGDRTLHVFSNREHKCARDDAGAAREGFIFHTSFVGADSDLIGIAFLNEIHVCALWRKHFVITNS